MSKRKNNKISKLITTIILITAVIISCIITFFPGKVFPSWNDIFRKAGLNETADISGFPFSAHFISVGQADCELIISDDKTILIDSGEVNSYLKINAYLQSQNVTEIDYFILTHGHSDHIGSAKDIIENYKINNIIMTKYSNENMPDTNLYNEFLTAVSNSSAKAYAAVPGDEYKITDDCKFTIIAPNDDYKEINNSSVVVRVDYKDKSFLFQGDAEKKSEKDILKQDFNLNADVIKLGHHGSKTSSTDDYLDAVNPTFAIISCGVNNQYNLPSEETIQKLNDRKIQFCRTDVNGTIVIATDGNELYMSTEK